MSREKTSLSPVCVCVHACVCVCAFLWALPLSVFTFVNLSRLSALVGTVCPCVCSSASSSVCLLVYKPAYLFVFVYCRKVSACLCMTYLSRLADMKMWIPNVIWICAFLYVVKKSLITSLCLLQFIMQHFLRDTKIFITSIFSALLHWPLRPLLLMACHVVDRGI